MLESLPDGWTVLHDLPWPGRQRANLDHVVIGPGGVFVVDAKNWSGRIEVRDQVLVQNGRRREGAVSSVTSAAIAVQELIAPVPCSGILCFVRDESLVTASWNVSVCSTASLLTVLTARPHLLGPDDVRSCAAAIAIGSARQSTQPGPSRGASNNSHVSRKGRRSLAALLGGLVLVVGLLSGGYQKAADWAGDRLAEVIVPDVPAQQTPDKPAKQKRQKDRKAKQSRQG